MFLAYGADANDSRADGGKYTKLHAPRRGDFECRGLGEERTRSGTEEVVERHFGLDDAGMHVAQESGGCHHRQIDSLAVRHEIAKDPSSDYRQRNYIISTRIPLMIILKRPSTS